MALDLQGIKNKVFIALDGSVKHHKKYKKISHFIEWIIILNVIAVVAETFEPLEAAYGKYFDMFEVFSVTIFLIEYLLMLWIADYMYPSKNFLTSALKRITSWSGIIDLLAIMPFFLPLIWSMDLRHLRILRLSRIVRIFRTEKYNHSLRLIAKILSEKRRELLGTLIIAVAVLVVASTLFYYIEKPAQPDKLPNIVNAFWWCIITLTTIGYGDMVPVTLVGKIIGSLIAVFGVLLMAIPIGILSTGFVQNMEALSKQKRLSVIRNIIKDAFRKKYSQHLGCEVMRGAISIEAIRVALEISDEEIIKLAEGKNDFRYRRLLVFENGTINRKLCLEYRICNTEYGIYNRRPSDICIVCPESYSKQSIGYLSYCVAEMLKCSHISNEFYGEEAEITNETFNDKGIDHDATCNFTINKEYLTETSAVPIAFISWKNHLKSLAEKKVTFFILDKDSSMESDTIIISGSHQVDEKKTDLFIKNLSDEISLNITQRLHIIKQPIHSQEHILNYLSSCAQGRVYYISLPINSVIRNTFPMAACIGRAIQKMMT
ncbi:MAG: ion transporter [Cytophagaceae bacterium]|nr:ion transporter [Cytophagaceae bacterium]MDW8456601.1 ion transporter [Cytophagaceae bacterium]